MGSFGGERGGIAVCVCRGVCTGGKRAPSPQERVSRLPGAVCAATLAGTSGHQDGRAGAPRHLSRRVQGCGIGESVNLDNLGLEITVHKSKVTSVP